jgi:hypothetical protein
MPSDVSPPSSRPGVMRARRNQDLPTFASLASFASSISRDSCRAMQSGADRCNSDDTTMTQPMTQTGLLVTQMTQTGAAGLSWPGGRVQKHDGPSRCVATFRPRRPTFAPVPDSETLQFTGGELYGVVPGQFRTSGIRRPASPGRQPGR